MEKKRENTEHNEGKPHRTVDTIPTPIQRPRSLEMFSHSYKINKVTSNVNNLVRKPVGLGVMGTNAQLKHDRVGNRFFVDKQIFQINLQEKTWIRLTVKPIVSKTHPENICREKYNHRETEEVDFCRIHSSV